jgi:hypothetical protein
MTKVRLFTTSSRPHSGSQLLWPAVHLSSCLHLSFCYSYPTGKHWAQHHRCWLAGQTVQEHAHRIVFQYYLETMWTAQQRRDVLIQRGNGMPVTKSDYIDTEYHAYQSESYVDRGLGVRTESDGDRPVWAPGMSQADSVHAMRANAYDNANFDCQNGGCQP